MEYNNARHSPNVNILHSSEGYSFSQVSPSICTAEATDAAVVLKQFVSLFTKLHWHSLSTLHILQTIQQTHHNVPIDEKTHNLRKQPVCTSTSIHAIVNNTTYRIVGFSLYEVSQSICPTEAIPVTAALENRTLLADPKTFHTLRTWWVHFTPAAKMHTLTNYTLISDHGPSQKTASFTELLNRHRMIDVDSVHSRFTGERIGKLILLSKHQPKSIVTDVTRTADRLTSTSLHCVCFVHVTLMIRDMERTQGLCKAPPGTTL